MAPGQTLLSWVKYILSGKERLANFFHGYWYAPQMVEQAAPRVFARFNEWLATTGAAARKTVGGPSIADLIPGVKPTLRPQSQTIEETRDIFRARLASHRRLGRRQERRHHS